MTGYLDLPDQRVYVEEHGGGEPLFLLHGGFVGAECWAQQIPAHVVGWSDGAYVAAHLALHRPDLVRSAVLIGQALSRDGETRAVRELMHDPRLADYFRDDYARTSPDGPEHYDVVFDKIVTMWRNPLEMPIAELARIAAPVLVMQGDDDGVRVEWSLELVRALPHGQFAVIPGTGHGAPLQRAELVNRMILEFLAGQAAGPPERLLPMGALHDVPAA